MSRLKLFLSSFLLLLISNAVKGEEYCVPAFSKARTVGYPTAIQSNGATTNVNLTFDKEEYSNKVVGNPMVVTPGESVSLRIETIKARWGIIRIYADLDGDGSFNEDTEKIGVFGDAGNDDNEKNLAVVETPKFTFPADYSGSGTTRLRILFTDGDTSLSTTACGSYVDGGFFDLDVNVLQPIDYCTPAFTASPSVGFISSATTTGASVNLDYATSDYSYKNAVVGNRMSVLHGEEITLTLKTVYALWGIVNVYADLNGDGSFSGDREFLASFGDPHNSGSNETDLATIEVPSFTIPQGLALSSIIRLRVIISGGTPQQVENQKKAGGCDAFAEGGYYDFEMEVKAEVKTYPVEYVGNLTGGSFVIKKGTEVVASGATLPEGTVLTVETEIDPGYELVSIKVNREAITGSSFALLGPSTVEVEIDEIVAGTAIRIPAQEGNQAYQLRFSDILLGTHTINNSDNDKRVRNITMSAWVKASSTGGEIFGYLQKGFYGTDGAFSAYIADGKLGIRNRYWLSGGNCPQQDDLVSDAELTNQWAFVTYVINDAGKKISLYKDGVKVAEKVLMGNGIGYLVDDCILFCSNKGFLGDFDEVQIWNKVLTEEEINESMAGYSETIPENLIYYYHFGEPTEAGVFTNKAAKPCDAALYKGTRSGNSFNSPKIVTDPQLVKGHALSQFVLNYEENIEGGTIEILDSKGNLLKSDTLLNKGTHLTVNVTLEAGYQVNAVYVNGQAIEGNSFFLSENATVTVELTNQLFLSYVLEGKGSIQVTNAESVIIENNSTFDIGEDLTIRLTSDEGYELTSFMVNEEDRLQDLVENTYTLSDCAENIDIKAVFELKKYKITISAGEGGTVSVKSGAQVISDGDLITHGTSLTIYLKPADATTVIEEFAINEVDRLPDLVANTFTFVINEPADIRVTFKKETFTFTSSVTGNGTLKVYAGDVEILSGSEIEKGTWLQVLLIPGSGETLTGLIVNDNDFTDDVYEGEVWLEVTGSMVINAAFSGFTSLNHPGEVNRLLIYDRSAQVIRMSGDQYERFYIYDIAGKMVYTSILESETVDVSWLDNGYYITKVISPNGETLSLKFVKN